MSVGRFVDPSIRQSAGPWLGNAFSFWLTRSNLSRVYRIYGPRNSIATKEKSEYCLTFWSPTSDSLKRYVSVPPSCHLAACLSNHPPVSPAVSLSIHVTVRPSVSKSELKIWAKKKVGGKEKKIHGNCPQRNTFPSQTLIQP